MSKWYRNKQKDKPRSLVYFLISGLFLFCFVEIGTHHHEAPCDVLRVSRLVLNLWQALVVAVQVYHHTWVSICLLWGRVSLFNLNFLSFWLNFPVLEFLSRTAAMPDSPFNFLWSFPSALTVNRRRRDMWQTYCFTYTNVKIKCTESCILI